MTSQAHFTRGVESRMPPSDDEYRATALHAMMGLRAELRRALNGPTPSRSEARVIAASIRELHGRALRILGEAKVDEFDDHVAAAREETLRIFGTSGWDEPGATSPDLPPLPQSRRRR